MSINWQALSKEKHLNSGWTPTTHFKHALKTNVVPVVAAELSHVLPFYPLAFLKAPQGGYQLVALLSLKADVNLFVTPQGRWVTPYVPSVLRSYPFNLMKNQNGNFVLAVDVASEVFHETAQEGDQPVLDSEGKPVESLNALMSFMQQRAVQQKLTDDAVAKLEAYGLIEAWTPQNEAASDSAKETKLGIYGISESALRALDGEQLTDLNKSQALDIAYAQLLSRARLNDLKVRQEHFIQTTATSNTAEKVDLDKLFDGDSEADVFSF